MTEVDLNDISGGRGQGRGVDECCEGTGDPWKSLCSVCIEQDQINKVLMDYSGCCIYKALQRADSSHCNLPITLIETKTGSGSIGIRALETS